MILIKKSIHAHASAVPSIVNLCVDRHKLAKKRWRGVAEDGTEFGFDLEEPLRQGTLFYKTDEKQYVIDQLPEPVFHITYTTPQEAARLAWNVGNLHFGADFHEDGLIVENDLALKQMFERMHIPFTEVERVFQPQRAAGGHHHHHHT